MKTRVIVEVILFGIMGFLCLSEGIRLVVHKDPRVVYDVLGPGFYVLFLAAAWISLGVVHLAAKGRKSGALVRSGMSGEMKARMVKMVLALALYIVLISTVGYLVASIVFFLLLFRIAGINSWRKIVILSLMITLTYYLVFIKYCNVIFPRGALFG